MNRSYAYSNFMKRAELQVRNPRNIWNIQNIKNLSKNQPLNEPKYTFKSKWSICFECMNVTPSRICFMKQTHAFSVNTNSSSITRSNSSPPAMLENKYKLVTVHKKKLEKCVWKLIKAGIHSKPWSYFLCIKVLTLH